MPATATLLTRSIQGESLSAATDRLANFAFKQGVIDFADDPFEVLEDTGSNMVITIGSGTAFDRAVIEGDSAGQGITVAEHQNATQTLSIAASDPTNDRIDRVIVRVYDDTFDSSGNEYTDLEVITGTPDASPVAPAEPSSSYTLATILVQDGVTAVTDSDITDLRFEAPIRGALVETIVYTAGSSFVKADHPWLSRVRIRVVAGGGGGGGAGINSRSAAGGGGGGYAEVTVEEAALAASETVTVGAGGAAGAAGSNNGIVGGVSSFGSHASATGGGPGLGTGGEVTGGLGGAGTAGDVQASGDSGETGSGGATITNGGGGGASMIGGGGRGAPVGVGTARAGQPGLVYGGGGGGGARTSVDAAGGAGAAGIVIVDLYA